MKVRNFFLGYPDSECAENDLTGKDYQLFLDICFRYCATVSFVLSQGRYAPFGDAIIPAELEKFRIPATRKIESVYGMASEAHHFRLCEESQQIIRSMASSIFSWTCDQTHHNPEDLAFFREDESIFFESIIHEGECYLRVKDDEDVSALVSNSRWIDIGQKKWY